MKSELTFSTTKSEIKLPSGKSYIAKVICNPTSSRTAKENYTILFSNAYGNREYNKIGIRKGGKIIKKFTGERSPKRNPWFLAAGEERKSGLSIWRKALAKFKDSLDENVMIQASREVGDYMVSAYKRHVSEGKGIDGPLPRGSDKYEARKLKKWGNKPVLVASGQLLESLDKKTEVK